MKKLFCLALNAIMLTSIVACSSNKNDNNDVFNPSLDKETKCEITVVGDYSNFEALEAEFDRFNDYYPNVGLSYFKLDDYKNTLGTVLEGNNKPNIFFS